MKVLFLLKRKGFRFSSLVVQLAVHLVGQDNQVMLLGELQDLLHARPPERRARRIAREVEEDRLRLLRHLLLERGDREAELVLDARLDANGDRVREPNGRRVADKARLVVEHLVARRTERTNRKVDRLRDADRDEDLLLPVELRVKPSLQVARDRLTELNRPEVRGVVRSPVLQARDRRP